MGPLGENDSKKFYDKFLNGNLDHFCNRKIKKKITCHVYYSDKECSGKTYQIKKLANKPKKFGSNISYSIQFTRN